MRDSQGNGEHRDVRPGQLSITGDVTEKDMKTVHAGLGQYVDEQIGDKRNGIGIKLAIRDRTEDVIGGLTP